MDSSNRNQIIWLIIGLGCGFLFMGAIRLSSVYPNILTPLAGYATLGYPLITVVFTIFLVRAKLQINRFGFGLRPDLRQLLLAVAAIVILRVYAVMLDPLIEELLRSSRNLERFSDVESSLTSLIGILIMNWTLAAFGEEFAFRIVLMRGILFLNHDTSKGQIIAILIQAAIFGLIHAYQGPVGIIGSTFSGLVFGVVTIAGRWSIWPAAIAHGANNTFGILALYHGS